ncbi:hypothetical protein JZX87_01765 [Agrobacterium sp. Ap1]|uniref:hypothetical protein n=1 Tax=Rhizobium/Agrobacterium group TaxID=227290 RepID=UPI001A902FB2|nr:hypothetical protein [Agrobacterium sp. Ap1]MBO0139890.1 hypothetical protein [Agrobacterium sp. Ap1]
MAKRDKRSRQTAEIELYLRQVARPAQKGQEPDDRRYDRDAERQLRKLLPEALNALLKEER